MATTAPQSPQQVFDTASKLLSEGKATEAADNYKAILDQGVTSPDLEGNYGRALVESGQAGEGIHHIMKAIALDRFDGRFRNDLRVAQARVDGGLGTPMSHPAEWGNRIGSWIRPIEALSLASILGLICLGLVILRRVRLKQMIGFAAGLALCIGLANFAQYGRSIAVVAAPAELRGAPLASAELIQNLPSGTRLRIIRVSGQFAEVERANGFRGWVPEANLLRSPY